MWRHAALNQCKAASVLVRIRLIYCRPKSRRCVGAAGDLSGVKWFKMTFELVREKTELIIVFVFTYCS